MRSGGSAHKGAQFEREIAQALSTWVSGGERRDLFWRSAGSGARATRGYAKGIMLANQAGDISAVASEGTVLAERFFIECKHLAKIDVWQFVLGRRSVLGGLWASVAERANDHARVPILIGKQNLGPILAFMPWALASQWSCCEASLLARVFAADVAIVSFNLLVEQRFSPPPRDPFDAAKLRGKEAAPAPTWSEAHAP